MNLPGFFSASTDQAAQPLFFAILITDGQAEAALWRVSDGQIEIMARSARHPYKDEQDCVAAVDQSLQELGKESEHVKETLFALNNDWVDANGIVAQKKSLFQKMTKELSLEPIGFVIIPEAITQYLSETSPQLSIFLIEVSQQNLDVHLIRNGQITNSVRVGRSGDSVSDLTEAFAHFTEKVFPSKIVLFSVMLSVEAVIEVQQQLIGYDWVGSYPFLHAPVIETLDSKPVMDIVVQTGGKAIAAARGLQKTEAEMVTETPVAESKTISQENANVEPLSADEIGFTSPLAAVAKETEEDEPAEIPAEIPEPPVEKPKKEQKMNYVAERSYIPADGDRSSPNHGRFIFFGVVTGLLVLSGLTFFAGKSLLHAMVTLQLNNQNVSKDFNLTLDPTAKQSDPNKLVIHADVTNKDEEGDKLADTTGTKIIGDKAKGTVTIFNYTTNLKNFATGTKLSSGNLIYLLDQATVVASASSSVDSNNSLVIKPGSADVTVTAAAIGQDSNIGLGIDLGIESFDSKTYKAQTKTALAGGSSRGIRAVSQQDKDQLLAALKKELTDKAMQDFKTMNGNGTYYVPTNRLKVVSAQFNGDVGKELDTLSLHLKITAEALAYHMSDLQPLTAQILASQVPAGYTLSNEPPQVLTNPITTSTASAQVVLQTNVSGTAQPSVDPQQWKSEILGKSEKDSLAILESKKEVRSAKIQFVPWVLGLVFHTLPAQPEKIEITTAN